MRRAGVVLSLVLLVALVGVACDRGRVIDAAERSRVITGQVPDTSPTAGLSIGRDSNGLVSRQGTYYFSLWDTRGGGYVAFPIALESLLRLDAPRVPQLTMSLMPFDMTCVETVGPDCVRWTRTVNLATSISSSLPNVDLAVSLKRGQRFRLEGDLGGGNQVIANYETFEIEFILGDAVKTLRTFRLAKQSYVNATPLAILSQSWTTLTGYEALDELLASYVFFPASSYGLLPQTATRQVLTATRWQIDRPFLNVTTGATQTIVYVVEKL